MGISEQEALARQLAAIWGEALEVVSPSNLWDVLTDKQRTAWIMVAQFVEARNSEPMATESNPITRIEPVQFDKPLIGTWWDCLSEPQKSDVFKVYQQELLNRLDMSLVEHNQWNPIADLKRDIDPDHK
jgi:hypothetical protein